MKFLLSKTKEAGEAGILIILCVCGYKKNKKE
jgi:hypothetical protein